MTIDRNKTARIHRMWGYKIAVNCRGEIVKIERVFANPAEIVGELYLNEEDTERIDRIFAILEWSKKAMLDALDRAFCVDYSHA
jgi:hypothetical protein